MGKKFAVALALVALMAAPAFASVQNVKVGGDINTTSFIRNGFDLGTGTTATENNRHQNVVLSQVNLNVDADLTDNVSTKIGLNNERLWGTNSTSTDTGTVAVETAYVKMKELLYSPLTVTIGRQNLAYGNMLIIGKSGTNRVPQVRQVTGDLNFDAIKAVLSYDPLTVDVFAAKITEAKLTSDGANSNVNLYGINANYKLGDKMSTVVEAYTFAKITGNAADGNGSNANSKKDAIYMPGLRVSTNPIEGLNVQLEGAYQTGTTGYNNAAGIQAKNNLSAYVLQGSAKYALPVMKDMSPVVSTMYTLFSGESSSSADAKVQEYQSMFNRQFGDVIWYNLFSQSNIGALSVGLEAKPIQDLTAKLCWTNLKQHHSTDTITLNRPDYLTAGAAVTAKGNRDLGNEVDLKLTYAYTEDVKFGVNAGYFAPGKALGNANDAATQLVSSVSVAF